MAQIDIINLAGEVVGQIDLNESVFGIVPNLAVVHQAMVCQRNNARRGTSDTQTRAEVSATGAKLFRQKGTGRARQGSKRAPHWKGGGVAFGPHPRSYAQSMPRKMRRLALRSVLSSIVAEQRMLVLDKMELAAPKTKEVASVLRTLGVEGKSMIVLPVPGEGLKRAGKNLPGLMTVSPGEMNLLDLLTRDRVIMTVDAVDAVSQWLGVD